MRTPIKYEHILNNEIPLQVMLNVLPTKGNLVYEYNPFKNYRLTENKYLHKGKFYSLKELQEQCEITFFYKYNYNSKEYTDKELEELYIYPDKNSIILDSNDISYYSKWKKLNLDNNEYKDIDLTKKLCCTSTEVELYEKGQLIDFDTDELKFSLEHPVHMVPQYSYDGSVNLIINDGLNIPRLINSRFSATGKNTYEIIDRQGNNDTNIYDQGEQFDIDTSLYKIVNNIPKLTFMGTSSGGNMKVGNYYFYFKLSDSDGNETDFIAESGLVSIFIGQDSFGSVYTGNKNENSTKQVKFKLENIDAAYDYINVYYSRSTAEDNNNFVTEYKKIDKKYPRVASQLIITGFEETIDVTVNDINLQYNLVESAKTSAVCQNMLFMGNVQKQNIPYEELFDLSLRILPNLGTEVYDPELDHYYQCDNNENSYIDTKFIYNKTGYWPEEFYRFGIVYILPNNQLTPVFNVRGAMNIGATSKQFSNIGVYTKEEEEGRDRRYIQYNENNFLLSEGIDSNSYTRENVKGVCRFVYPNETFNNRGDISIFRVDFEIPSEVRTELKKYVKGFFFVRQTRIPLILTQGITIGIDNESRTPTIPTAGGILSDLSNELGQTHVETENINGLNYISEGFLKRYTFRFKKKSSGLWSKIAKIAGIAAIVAAVVVLGVVTGGGAFAATAAIYGTAVTATATGILCAAAAVAVGTAAAVVTTVIATVQEVRQAALRIGEKKRLNGRETKAPKGYKIVETDDSRMLTHSYRDRIIIKDPTKNKVQAIICPDYTINQPYYNQIFTGNTHLIRTDVRQSQFAEAESGESYFSNEERYFYIQNYRNITVKSQTNAKIIGVPDNIKNTGIEDYMFKARAGDAEESYKCLQVATEREGDDKKINSDIIRGSFGPYLGFTNNTIGPAKIVNIYIPGYSDLQLSTYMDIRMQDSSTYFAISDRINILEEVGSGLINDQNKLSSIYPTYRGDCYICQFTQRINRNFNDPSAPYNDEFVKTSTWRDNYNPDDPGNHSKINAGDVNAVQLGMWVTFQLRSSNNLNIRSLDGSNVDESAMTGNPRGYYPVSPLSVEGIYKKPESQVYNKGFTKSVSDKWNFVSPNVPHIKNWFGTRIMYSDIHINDAYKNGFRVFQGTNYRDYTREYGEIVKLISLESNLLCVFEHGIALIPVNERAVAGQGAGGNIYINTSNVLPENPKIISDMFGSQWPESIIKVPGITGDSPQYVYGVDTVAKKIWRTNGSTIECISDFKVQEFLNNNITLGERELTPKIGIRNVKTHYNAFKRDVMFTFYDNTQGFEEKVWNLCWNELLQKFITFYSWVPSYMENINNIPFSFDRNTSKWVAKLGISHIESSFAEGITLTNVITNDTIKDDAAVDNLNIPITYLDKHGQFKTIYGKAQNSKFIAGLFLSPKVLPNNQVCYNVKFSLEHDIQNNYKMFTIEPLELLYNGLEYSCSEDSNTCFTLPDDAKFAGAKMPLYALCFKTGNDEFKEVLYYDSEGYHNVFDINIKNIYYYTELYSPKALYSELYYRNKAGNSYSDIDANKIGPNNNSQDNIGVNYGKPIFKDLTGKRLMLPKEEQINPNKLVVLLNIKADISIVDTKKNDETLSDTYYDLKATSAGYYESTVAITPKWNMQFLSTDFWKHGQAGIIDITDDIKPTYWYGKQHPFEFECVVVNDPAVHKIFQNLELVANKAKPESFHYEIIGDSYDFAKDKVNMYFRQEAIKALWQHNGADITFDRNFLKVNPRQQAKSADFPHIYYNRQDTINDVEDYYVSATYKQGYDYRHLAGAEIIYYLNRQEYRIWNHVQAVSMDDLLDTTNYWDRNNINSYNRNPGLNKSPYQNYYSGGRSIIGANCQYLEDKWRITINPINVCYKNEYKKDKYNRILIHPSYTTWNTTQEGFNKPKLPIMNSPIPNLAYEQIKLNNGSVDIPDILPNYTVEDIDFDNWINSNTENSGNRKELDIKDKFIKIRIRYSGEELAIIDYLNTIYRISYV